MILDAAVRSRILNEFDRTFVVEAAAGTGKTTALVGRVVALLESGLTTLDRIIAVTFTESAAGELKLRLRSRIESRLAVADEQACRNLLGALPQLEEARIGTIHSLCSDLLREHPVEAELDPRFEVAAEGAQERLFVQAFDRWFQRELATPSPGVRRFLRRRPDWGTTARRQLLRAALTLAEWRDYSTPWRQDPLDREPWLDRLVEAVAAVGDLAPQGIPGDSLTKSLNVLARFVQDIHRKEQSSRRDYDGLEADFAQLRRDKSWTWPGKTWSRHGFDRATVLKKREDLRSLVTAFCNAAEAHLAAELQRDLAHMLFDYETLKAKAGQVDFQDLLIRTRDLLRDNPFVRTALQERYSHLFVDEFQDTDPLQGEILMLLAADAASQTDWRAVRPVPGKIFIVGDPKQSIYRFRRADVCLYESIKQQIISSGGEVLHLQVSFRSAPELQGIVNAAFEVRMGGQSVAQARYVAMMPYRQVTDGPPRLIALPVPAPYGDYGNVTDKAIESSYPDTVAAFIEWLLHSGWTVTERDNPVPVPVEARHVCLLFKRFRKYQDDLTQPYVQALEARQIGHILVGGTSFHLREEVGAIRNALTAIEWPDDELSVFATLHGPLFSLLDGHLLAYRTRYGALHPYRLGVPAQEPELQAVADALQVLQDLHRGRNRRPVAVTISRLLSATRAHAGFAIWHSGEQALANVTRLMDMARQAEQDGLTSFRAFVQKLQDDAEYGEASEAPILEEGTGGVRLMTVHKAKGLEFPVVVLCDPTAPETPSTPSRWVEADRSLCALRVAGCSPVELLEHAAEELERETEEAVRLLYVASTRARDLLVVPVVGDQPLQSWVRSLGPAVYPSTGSTPTLNPHCPVQGNDTVLMRTSSQPVTAIAPGEYAPELGTHRVVWWDPATLRLNVGPALGLRQERLLQATGEESTEQRSRAGVEAHAAWQRSREAVRDAARQPSIRVSTATELEAIPVSDEVTVEVVAHAENRPHGPRFGTLVHAVLASIDMGADNVQDHVSLYGRIVGATEEEQSAAVGTVQQALAHPLLRAAAESPACRREMPVLLPQADGSLVEGVVDLAFQAADGWTVVDFKTDRELSDRLADYRRQVGLYVDAVRQSTGLPTRGVLLQV